MAFKKAYYHGVPIWYNEETCEVEPRKRWLSIILDFIIWWDMDVMKVDEFEIYIEDGDRNN